MGSISGDDPAPAAALGDDPAPSEALAGSLPEGSQASPTDPAPLSGGAAPSPQTGLADEPADDEGRHGRRVRFVAGRTSQFVRKPPSFRPRVADTFARSHGRPDVDSVSASSDDAEPVPLTNQHDTTKTTQANPPTSSSKGSPNDEKAEKVPRRFDGRMGGLAGAGRRHICKGFWMCFPDVCERLPTRYPDRPRPWATRRATAHWTPTTTSRGRPRTPTARRAMSRE